MLSNIGIILKKSRNEAKMSVKQISDILTQKGFKASESTIYSWENGNSQPTPGALLVMCGEYGIKDILKTFGYDGYNEDGSIQLNINEVDLVEKYRTLDTHGKDIVDIVLNKESERMTELKTSQATVIDIQPHLEVNAAHARTNIDVTDEDQAHDDAIMNDDSEWE